MDELIAAFLGGKTFAVVGASADRAKFGNQVLRCYQRNGRIVYPVNPRLREIEGLEAYAALSELPEPVHGVSIVTPPAVTEVVVAEALSLGIRHIWIQPGAESAQAIDQCTDAGINCIAGGPCVLVELG